MAHLRPPKPIASLALACVLACAASPPALAQWSSDPAINLGVCVEPGAQSRPAVVTDGDGGLIVFWADERPAAPGLYAQRLDRLGYALWDAGGIRVSPDMIPWLGWTVAAASDGAGGAIVAWESSAGGPVNVIFAQRLTGAGAPLWGSGGAAVSTRPASTGSVFSATGARIEIAADGAGGAAIAWSDTTGFLALQCLDDAGQRAWPVEAILGDAVLRDMPQVSSDGAGGAIVCWRTSAGPVVVQRVDATGAQRWGPGGVPLAATGFGSRPNLVSDGAGGAIASWMEYFEGLAGVRLMAQRLDSLGVKQWAPGGVQAVPGSVDQGDSLLADGNGGAFVVWQGQGGVRVQHVGPAGAPLWDSAGVAMNSWASRASPVLAPAPDGGVFVAWLTGDASGNALVLAQSLSAAGAPRWGGAPVEVCRLNPAWSMWGLGIVGDGQGGLLATWADERNRFATGADVFAQRVGAGGTLDAGPLPHPAALALAAGPVPSRRGETVSVRFTLARAGRARVALHDVSGRLVRVLADGAREAGTHAERWDGRDRGGRPVPPGLYFARAQAAGRAAFARIVVTD